MPEIKAVGFDVGHTIVSYKNPLNWKPLYRPALQRLMQSCGIEETEQKLESAVSVLMKYNTREHYREYEVSSNTIFGEIFAAWDEDSKSIETAKEAFYGFFQEDAELFDDTRETLEKLAGRGLKLGFLTDVAYGTDNRYSFEDIEPVMHLFDVRLSSVDVGFRKPNEAGYMLMAKRFGVDTFQMIYVGDEEKDIVGARRSGIVSVLIDRERKKPDYGQQYTICGLIEILDIIDAFQDEKRG